MNQIGAAHEIVRRLREVMPAYARDVALADGISLRALEDMLPRMQWDGYDEGAQGRALGWMQCAAVMLSRGALSMDECFQILRGHA